MPRYKVNQKGFFDGRIYDPNGKRPFLTTDKPFTAKNKPSWVGDEVVQETARQKAARQKAEKKDAEKLEQDKIEVDAVTFDDGPAPSQPAVETL